MTVFGARATPQPAPTVPASHRVRAPADPVEVEADAVAERMLRTPSAEVLQPCPGGCPGADPPIALADHSAHHPPSAPTVPTYRSEQSPARPPPEADLSPSLLHADQRTAGLATTVNSRVFRLAADTPPGHDSGRPLETGTEQEMSRNAGFDFSSVRVHTDDAASRLSRELRARAFTRGSDIYFRQGEYRPHTLRGRRLIAHELAHVMQSSGVTARTATGRGLVGRVLREDDGETDIERLDEMLDRWNVPEAEVIALIAGMSADDKATVASGSSYREKLSSALNFSEMMQVVTALPLELAGKLGWLNDSATFTSAIGYDEIRDLVAGAPQAERDALKTDAWRSFFVDVCTNETMLTAVDDLGFDLATQLEWVRAEMTITSWELDYATIQPLVTGASQADRNALKTDAWRDFFVDVCTNVSMETAVTDLGFPLKDQLRWLIAEGCDYVQFKSVINAASAADKNSALGDQLFLLELKDALSWNDFAKCVELLGRAIPGPGALLGDATVQTALANAWTDSNPAIVPAPPAPAPAGVHEEGGFVYLDIVTDTITTDRVAAGGQASLSLNDPDPPDNAITVAGYHTHPNVGPAWGAPFPSGADVAWASSNGIPLLIRGAFPTVASTSDTSTGSARAHIAGDRGFPGPSGGIAPQATLDGETDDV